MDVTCPSEQTPAIFSPLLDRSKRGSPPGRRNAPNQKVRCKTGGRGKPLPCAKTRSGNTPGGASGMPRPTGSPHPTSRRNVTRRGDPFPPQKRADSHGPSGASEWRRRRGFAPICPYVEDTPDPKPRRPGRPLSVRGPSRAANKIWKLRGWARPPRCSPGPSGPGRCRCPPPCGRRPPPSGRCGSPPGSGSRRHTGSCRGPGR